MNKLIIILIGLVMIVGCERSLTPEEEEQKQALIEYLEVLDTSLPSSESEAEGWKDQYNDFYNNLKENYGYKYESEYAYLKDKGLGEIVEIVTTQTKQSYIEEWENLYLQADNSFVKQMRLESLAKFIFECGRGCKTSIITFEQAKEIVENGEYDKSLTFIDGEYVSFFNPNESYSTSTTSNEPYACKEVEGTYTSQGLSVSSCRYSSSKERISITVENNSGVDLRYLEVEIYGIDSNGKTVSSDYTNHSSTIRNGASQTLETYVDEAHSYEVEITKATPK
ncbi:MAG: FxLYD domain-containing protein [Turicibacter sp.]|nr:FxLYD domain-containing protein [Turicibacter sp.]